MTAADRIAAWLAHKEIHHVFGIIGAGNVALWDAIARLERSTLVPVHHEQAAAMASAYYNRTCDRLASAVLVTTGGGAANAITGVMAAYMDSIPLLVISGNEPSRYLDKPLRVVGVQGFFTAEVARPLTKWSFQCRVASALPLHLDVAYKVATEKRPGPAWLDIPRDLQTQEVQ